MLRKDFLCRCCGLAAFGNTAIAAPEPPDELARTKAEKTFVQNWLADLLEAIDTQLDRPAAVKLVEACGKGCYRRFQFKQDIAAQGKGDLQKLIQAYKKNFEIWQDGERVHIRYGEVSSRCYCPAANYRPSKPNDLHCECTRMTHQTIFETALGRPLKVEIAESLRRGGKTCHFVVHVA